MKPVCRCTGNAQEAPCLRDIGAGLPPAARFEAVVRAFIGANNAVAPPAAGPARRVPPPVAGRVSVCRLAIQGVRSNVSLLLRHPFARLRNTPRFVESMVDAMHAFQQRSVDFEREFSRASPEALRGNTLRMAINELLSGAMVFRMEVAEWARLQGRNATHVCAVTFALIGFVSAAAVVLSDRWQRYNGTENPLRQVAADVMECFALFSACLLEAENYMFEHGEARDTYFLQLALEDLHEGLNDLIQACGPSRPRGAASARR